MIYNVLGDLDIRGPHGGAVTLPRGRTPAVLAALLVMPNRQLSHAELLTAAWGRPDVAVAQLHKRISLLRHVFAEAGIPDAIRTHDRFGYALETGERDLDLLKFQRLVRQADADRAAGRVAQEADRLRAALDLWRGPEPLANITGHALQGDIDDLKRRRRRIAARLFTAEIARGRSEAVLDELQQFAAEDPADSTFCRPLMTALYLTRRNSEAIAAYDRYVKAIEHTSGGRPDPALRDLSYAMSNHQDDIVAKAAGRADLLTELARLLREPAEPEDVLAQFRTLLAQQDL